MRVAISVPGRWCLAAAIATWFGVVLSLGSTRAGIAVAAGCVVCASVVRGRLATILALFVLAGVCSGLVAGLRTAAIVDAEVPSGRVTIVARVAEQATARSYGRAVIEPLVLDGANWAGPRLATTGLDVSVDVGSTVTLVGDLSPGVSRVRDEVVAGILRVDSVLLVDGPTNPIVRVANAARRLVTQRYDGSRRTDGLVRGLLIGDTDLLPATQEEDLRRAGLAHYIAVSGSNVAMFLVAWWFLTAPIALRPTLRVAVGIVGLIVFSVITRWEPSVIRASVMAGTLLVGGLVGVPLDPWMAMGTAVTLLLLVSGHLAMSVGFQLSVAATAGVIVGVAFAAGRKPAWLWVPLYVTMGAQIAVAPIILLVFGALPLFAPLTNLIVGPVVAFTTAVSAFAIFLPILKPISGIGADIILTVARVSASGPQLGVVAFFAVAVTGLMTIWRQTRPVGLAAVVLMLLWTATLPAQWPSVPTMVVLDIGQGDAILLQDPSGFSMLIDGGSSPRLLDRALRRNGVRRLDIVVVTHADADHLGGVLELLSSGSTGELWIPATRSPSDLLDGAVQSAIDAGVTVRSVQAGVGMSAAEFRVDVIGPVRRYQSDNDSSVVLWITSGRTVFLGGDVEAIAQAELPVLHPDIMVVPHHGSASTDLAWLNRTVGRVAILSYGPNRYGHPSPDVVAVLNNAGAVVRRTFVEGDVTIALVPP